MLGVSQYGDKQYDDNPQILEVNATYHRVIMYSISIAQVSTIFTELISK